MSERTEGDDSGSTEPRPEGDEPQVTAPETDAELSLERGEVRTVDADDLAASAERVGSGGVVLPFTEDEGGESHGADDADTAEGGLDAARLVSVIESLLFASDKPLTVSDLRRLLDTPRGSVVEAALERLRARQDAEGAGIILVSAAGGYQLRTNPTNAPWLGKLLVGKPVRLSRAMLETLAIIAYRQPVTRPEIDEIRGVDCGPVLKTLLERGVIRVIGKKEDVGRPLLYGTTPEFLRIFNLKDLTELPTLREFHELGAEEQAKVRKQHGPTPAEVDAASAEGAAAPNGAFTAAPPLPERAPDEDEQLLSELDQASEAAARAVSRPDPTAAPPPEPPPGTEPQS